MEKYHDISENLSSYAFNVSDDHSQTSISRDNTFAQAKAYEINEIM
jgi:hypothetical protein